MESERSHDKPELGPRSVESAVLAIVIERHPLPVSRSSLLLEMKTETDAPRRDAEVELAVGGLAEVGLLVLSNGVLTPTAAALRAGELELGL
jgi:hypothetical protein